jgi:hypothetical protein
MSLKFPFHPGLKYMFAALAALLPDCIDLQIEVAIVE